MMFLFWKRLREDYPSNFIFTTAIFVIVGVLAGFFLSAKFFPLWWFWASFLGGSLGYGVGALKYKLRFFESFEALVLGLFPWLGGYFFLDSIVNSSIVSLGATFLVLGLLSLFALIDKHYKNFTWYRSGRIGLAGLTTLGTFLLLRAAIASFFPHVLSFAGKLEPLVSGVLAFFVFLATFNLARSET